MVSNGVTDNLIQRTREGDIDAFHQLYDLYAKRLLNFCFRMIGSKSIAEEVTQETFISVYKNIGALKDISRFEPWLFMIARNYVFQALRRRKPESPLADGPELDRLEAIRQTSDQETPEEKTIEAELRRAAIGAIQSLDLKYREAFVLAVLEGRSYKEVADMLGIKIQAVKTNIHRARLKIREKLSRFISGAERHEAM